MTSLIPSKVFGLSRGRMDLPFTEMAKVVREWKGRCREEGEQYSLNKLGVRCLLESILGVRGEASTRGITLGVISI